MTSMFAESATVFATNHFDQGIIIIILGMAAAICLMKKFLQNNPEVKDAAKKAASSKAIELINRFLRK